MRNDILKSICASVLLAIAMTVKASDFVVDGIRYNIISDEKNTVEVIGNNYTGDISIPDIVTYNNKTYSVTSIGWEAFKGCSGLTSVTIPNSVTSIGWEAFKGCSGLTSVTIGNSVTSIGFRAFSGCSGLTSVTIPNSVTSINWYAFEGCSRLEKVIVPNFDIKNWCSIGFGEYLANPLLYAHHLYSDENTEITELVIPDGVTSIGNCAFLGCSGLTSVTIPNSVTSIGEWAFSGCSGLTSVTIPNSVTSIGREAFSGCSGLTSVTIPNSVTSIGREAFPGCSGLTEIKVADDNNVYDSRNNCNAIIETSTNTLIVGCKNTIIPNSVTSIGEWAFSGCSGLTSVTIPNSVTSIGNGAFGDCSGLTSVTIPNSVTSIGSSAFDNCSGLTSVTIPNSVTKIGEYAFVDCSGLTSVTIPNSVTSIGCAAFYGCSGLTSMTIPNSVTSIDEGTFYSCSGLTSVTIPNSVTSIESEAFYGCSGLTSVKVMRKEPPTMIYGCSFSDVSNILLYVPYGSKAKYEAAQYWKDFNIRMLSDSNGDDTVNEIDYSGVASHIMGESPAAFDAEASDVDVNGTVDVRDYVGIANIITTGSIYGGTSNNAKAAMSKGAAMPVTDDSNADNVIYVENVSGSKNSQVELSVRMRNASDIRGFQFDLYLPEGVTMANNAKASLSSDRLAAGDAHTLMADEMSDGAVRFLCSSMNDENFAGGDGEIATLTVNIADNVANGDYDVVVKNAIMTETDISKSYEADNIKSTLTVLDQTGVETVTADNERRDGTIYTVGGQLVGKKSTTSQLRKGIYIRNGRKFVK